MPSDCPGSKTMSDDVQPIEDDEAAENSKIKYIVGGGVAAEIVRLFVETPFEGGRHGRRVDKIHSLEG